MVELLAPAGDFEKLKTALIYGADAVFIGGQDFSLRARASNFSVEDIKEAVKFTHSLGKKIYITTNIIPHEEDLTGLIEYLKNLEEAKVDAIITASPNIISAALKNTNLEVHLSTQQSALNSNTINFWFQKGVKRVVLARELSLLEIDEIMQKVKADIEVFIHGGMCMSYSGRCSLSDNMTGRDANRGGCAHSCRWNYKLLLNDEQFEKPFSMSSKDLQAIRQTIRLIKSGVSSLKIEGRMKSQHYIATVVKVYRMLIDEYLQKGEISNYDFYEKQISKAENRPASFGYLEGMPTINQQLFNEKEEKPNQNFVGLVLESKNKDGLILVEQRNYFKVGDEIQVFSPEDKDFSFVVEKIYDDEMNEIEIARNPKKKLYLKIPFDVKPYSMLRKND